MSANPWNRLPDETEEEFEFFTHYRDQRPPRNIIRVAKATPGLGIHRAQMLSKKHDWPERTREFDAHLRAIHQREVENVVRETAKERAVEHLALLGEAREIASLELSKLLKWVRETEIGVMQPGQVLKILETVIKCERLVAGESTENTQNTQLFDLSGLSVEELRALGSILGKAGVNLPGLPSFDLTQPTAKSNLQ